MANLEDSLMVDSTIEYAVLKSIGGEYAFENPTVLSMRIHRPDRPSTIGILALPRPSRPRRHP